MFLVSFLNANHCYSTRKDCFYNIFDNSTLNLCALELMSQTNIEYKVYRVQNSDTERKDETLNKIKIKFKSPLKKTP